jgi:GT2 family glycosyltransferase
MPSLRVIVVNFNAGASLVNCIEAVLQYPDDLLVTVVDNASSDGSAQEVASRFGNDPRVELVVNSENLGYARAANRIARQVTGDYVLILNPDCFLQPGALTSLVDALERDQKAGVAGPWVTDRNGKVQSGTWRRFPDPWRALMTFTGLHRFSGRVSSVSGVNCPSSEPPAETMQVEAVSGACMLLRRSAAERVDYFDEEYSMHCEDLDLMKRLAMQGLTCLLVPQAKGVHEGGVSSASRPWWVHRQKHIGMQRYFRKFQAEKYAFPFRWSVYAGIWFHYALTLPAVYFRSRARAA